MSGLTLTTLREALRDQLAANIERDITVRAYPPAPADGPSITIVPSDDYLDYWASFSSVGLARVRFDLLINPAGSDYESSLTRLDDFLSAGTDNNSSVVDAVFADLSLGLEGVTTHIQTATADNGNATGLVTVEIHVNKT